MHSINVELLQNDLTYWSCPNLKMAKLYPNATDCLKTYQDWGRVTINCLLHRHPWVHLITRTKNLNLPWKPNLFSERSISLINQTYRPLRWCTMLEKGPLKGYRIGFNSKIQVNVLARLNNFSGCSIAVERTPRDHGVLGLILDWCWALFRHLLSYSLFLPFV